MSVAERLYLADGSLSVFRASVADIREFSRKDGVQIWQVALDRTAFYPTGGGQPHDRGFLRARARSGAELTVSVDDVTEDEAGEIWHATTKPLLAGTEVEGVIDEERRLDHTQQHSGQHVLSAILAAEFGASTVGFHLGEDDTTIDLAIESKAAQAELVAQLDAVEQRANRCIANNLPVRVLSMSNEEAQALLASGALRKLPPRSGDIRLIEIPGLDLNACGGTHVHRLGEIGCVLLRGSERVRKTLRLHFLCGMRGVRAARADFAELSAAAAALSTGTTGVFVALERLQAEARIFGRERQQLREDIAERHAVQLAVEERIVGGMRIVSRRFPDRDVDYLKLLAERLLAAVPQTVALLVSTLQEPATLVLASNLELEPGCHGVLKRSLSLWNLRSGGTARQAQAQVPAMLLDPVTEEVTEHLQALR